MTMNADTKRWLRLTLLCAVGFGLLRAAPASAEKKVNIGAGATVVTADLRGKQVQIIVNRGTASGLKVGTIGEFFPMHKVEGNSKATVDFDVRLARGKVVKATADKAWLSFDAKAGTVGPGNYFSYNVSVPAELAKSPLFRVTALGVVLTPQYKKGAPFTTYQSLAANPSQAHRDKVLDAMVADIKSIRAVIAKNMVERITEGRYHGKTPAQIVDGLDRGQVREFLRFVEAFPGKYLGHYWPLPEVFMTWVINGTPSGARELKLRTVRPMIQKAYAAAKDGNLDAARIYWKKVLETVPDHDKAKSYVERIEKVQLLLRRLKDDPDDTKSRYRAMSELFSLEVYSLCAKHNEALRKRNYEPFNVDLYRGYLLVRQEKWQQAIKLFKRLLKEQPKHDGLNKWHDYSVAKLRLKRSPGDPKALLAMADLRIREKNWDSAMFYFRKVLESNRANRRQAEAARKGQERLALKKRLEVRVRWAKESIRKHKNDAARNRVNQALAITEKLGDAKEAATILAELAELARTSNDEELAIELFERRAAKAPDDIMAHAELAFASLVFDRLDQAEKSAKTALTKKGDKGWPYLLLAHIARARGDLAEAEKLALKAGKDDPKYPWPHTILARTAAAKGDWHKAVKHARRALELKRDPWEIRGAYTAVLRGQRAHEALQADPSSARERLRLIRSLARLALFARVAEEIAKLPADRHWRREAWWALASSGDSRLLLSERLKAGRAAAPTSPRRKIYLALLEAQAKLRANPKDARTRMELAKLHLKRESYSQALAALGPLVTDSPTRAVGDIINDARAGIEMNGKIELAQQAQARQDYEGAIRLSAAAQKVYDRIGCVSCRVRAREVHGDALVSLGRHKEAIALLREARSIIEAAGDPLGLVIVDRRLASYLAAIGTTDPQYKAAREAAKICDEHDDEECLYYAEILLAQLEKVDGRSARAVEHARRAWKLAEQLGRLDQARSARFELADANLVASRFSDSERIAKKLLVDSREHSDVMNEQFSLMVLGAVALHRGQGKIARARFQEVYELGTRTGQSEWRALARKFEGKAWLSADHNPTRAAKALEQSARLYESLGEGWATEVRGEVLRELADALMQAGKLKAARKTVNEALALTRRYKRRPDLVAVQTILVRLALKEGKADEALTTAEEAVRGAKQMDTPDALAGAYHVLALARERKGLRTKALEAYEEALDYLGRAMLASGGESEREGYMSVGRVRDVYKDAIALMLKMGRTSRAMEILELSRDARLKQTFDPTKIETKDKKLRARLARYELARARVQGLEKQLAEAKNKGKQRSEAQVKALGQRIARTRQELQQVVLDLKLTHRHLFQALEVDPQNLVARRSELPKGAVLVQYFVASDALYAFLISAGRSQPGVVRVNVSAETLEQTVASFRDAIDKEPEEIAALGRKLDDWLLEPLRPHLQGAKTLVIMPFGPLYYVPFDALVVSEPGQPVRYAIEDLRISIQTGNTLENLLEPNRPAASGTMLAISNPDGSLPGAQREVKRIVSTAIPDAKVLVRKQATVKRFQSMAGSFRYLHLATHGVLDRDPRKTHLKMADGPLTVHQIAGLQGLERSNELVVLSACNTAVERGKSTGDELVSLAFAFAMAGSPALLASLWEVDDASTAELMATFYRALESGNGDRLDALRAAKLKLLRSTRARRKIAKPHWASFQLYGDFRAPRASGSR